MPNGSKRAAGRSQAYTLLGECFWMTVMTAVMVAILFLPDQMRELYRIAIAEAGWFGYAKMMAPVSAMAAVIWFGTKVVTTDGRERIDEPGRLVRFTADAWPALLCALPVLALAGGFFYALPSAKNVSGVIVGSVFESYGQELQDELGALQLFALITAGLALVFLLLGYALSRASTAFVSTANDKVFRSWWFLLGCGLTLIAVTILHYLFPEISYRLEVVGTLALFTLCVIATTAHLTIMSFQYRWPMLTVLIGLAITFSLLNWNDNHEVRRVSTASPTPRPASAPHAADEFLAWYDKRPDLGRFTGEYPVYVVAAQGGGSYAAYQTAIFLARMQDVCPAFKDHLFAISAVSGGSLGAAIFTAALETVRARTPAQPAPADAATPFCPRISIFLGPSAAVDEKHVGPVEREVRAMLARDFLSPLVGATLFPDFSQRFLPWAFGGLDRARALEGSFEAAAPGPLSESFLAHWNIAQNRGPALLLNSTDAATGKRVVIAPFALRGGRSKLQIGGLAHFPFWNLTEQNIPIEEPVDIRLSTAASISARFPWLSPAATVTVTDAISSKSQSVRLVDGGYADNSGVETVLDLIHSIKTSLEKIEAGVAQNEKTPSGAKFVKVKLVVMTMSGGDYPTRTSYYLGETLEPIRALLSTRQSRGYVAIDRGRDELGREEFPYRDRDGGTVEISLDRLRISKLTSQFYELPLGWSLGDRSRDIIEKQSGRFWECEFNERFEQEISAAAKADCLQMLVYHELNQSLPSEARRLAVISRYRSREVFGPGKRLDNQEFLRCYRETQRPRATLLQLRAVEAILSAWDKRVKSPEDRLLAFALAMLAWETGNFRFREENLRYTPQRLEQVFAIILTEEQRRRIAVEGDRAVADIVYGPQSRRGPSLGNIQPGDGWRYRGRGVAGLTGRANYVRYGEVLSVPLEEDPDLVLVPDIGAEVALAHLFMTINPEQFFKDQLEDWQGAVRRYGITDRLVANRIQTHGRDVLDCITRTRRP